MRLQQAAQPPPVMLVAVAWRGCGILPAPCQSPARHHPLSTYPLSPVLGKFLHSKNRVCFGSAAPSSVAQGRHHLSARLERGWAHRMGLRARTPPSSRRRSQIPRPQRRGRLRPMRLRRRMGRPRGRGAALADSPDPSNQAPSAPMSAASSRGFARLCLSPCSAARAPPVLPHHGRAERLFLPRRAMPAAPPGVYLPQAPAQRSASRRYTRCVPALARVVTDTVRPCQAWQSAQACSAIPGHCACSRASRRPRALTLQRYCKLGPL